MLPDLIAATSIPSSLTLASGISIDDPYGRLLRFSREEYEYYDAIPDLEPHRIVPIDVLATWSVNSNLYVIRPAVKIKDPATKLRGVHRALAEACDSVLASVPPRRRSAHVRCSIPGPRHLADASDRSPRSRDRRGNQGTAQETAELHSNVRLCDHEELPRPARNSRAQEPQELE